MYDNEDKKWLYGKFSDAGLNIGSYEDFEKSLQNDDDKKWYHEKATSMGLNVGSYDDFNSLFGVPAAPQTNQVDDVTAQRNRDFAHQYEYAQDKVVDPRLSDSEKRQYVDFVGNYADRYEQIRGQYGRTEAPAPETQQTFRAGQRYESQANGDLPQLLKDAGLTAKDVSFEWGGGQSGSGYYTLTPEQAEIVNKTYAEKVLKQGREALIRRSYGTQIDEAMKDAAKYKEQLDAISSSVADVPAAPGAIMSPKQAALMANKDYVRTQQAYTDALDRAHTLEMMRDGTINSFWANAGEALLSPERWTFGLSSLYKAGIVADAMKNQDKETSQETLKQALLRNETEAMFANTQNNMGRWGTMTGEMAQFIILNAMGSGLFEGLGKSAEGAIRGSSDAFARKFLGKMANDLTLATLTANTIGAANTIAEALQRKQGFLDQDENGNYVFKDGEGWFKSIYGAEVNQITEYFTERLGEHFGAGAKWAAGTKLGQKLGLGSVMKFLDREPAFGLERGIRNFFKSAGINQYPGEVLEEEIGIVMSNLLQFKNPLEELKESQADILGGMAFSIGLMQSVPIGLNLAGRGYNKYYGTRLNSRLNSADKDGAAAFGDEWEGLRTRIDDTVNEDITPLIYEIAQTPEDKMSREQKRTALNYIDGLMRLRGYTTGTMSEMQRQMMQAREEAGNDLISQYGKFWTDEKLDFGDKKEHKPLQFARRVSFNGRSGYVIGEKDGKMVVNIGGGMIAFVNEDALTEDSGRVPLFVILDERSQQIKAEQEQQRMRAEAQANANALAQQAVPGATVEVGAEESKEQATVLGFENGEYVLQKADGSQIRYTPKQMADAFGLPYDPMSDAQLDAINSRVDELTNLFDQKKGKTYVFKQLGSVRGEIAGARAFVDTDGSVKVELQILAEDGTTQTSTVDADTAEQILSDIDGETADKINAKMAKDAVLEVRFEDGSTASYQYVRAESQEGETVIIGRGADGEEVELLPEMITNYDQLTGTRTDADGHPVPADEEMKPVSEQRQIFDDPIANALGIGEEFVYVTKDGRRVVNSTELWNKNPELWVKWNDQNANRITPTLDYLGNKVKALDTQVSSKQKELDNANTNGADQGTLEDLQSELRDLVARQGRIRSLYDSYAAAEQRRQEEARRAADEEALVKKIFPNLNITDPVLRHEIALAAPALERVQKLEGLSVIEELGEALSREAEGESLTPTEATMRMFSEAAKTPGLLASMMEQYAEVAESVDADTVAEKQDILGTILAENQISIENGTIGTDQSGVSADASVRADASGEGEVGPAADTAGSGGAAPVQGARNPAAVRQAIIDNAQQRLDDWNARMQSAATDEERQTLLQEKEQIIREMLDQLGAEGVVVTNSNEIVARYEQDGARQSWIDKLREKLETVRQTRQRMRGFFSLGNVYVLADYITDAMDAVTTYAHEGKHRQNASNNAVGESLQTGVSRRELATAVYNLTKSDIYDNEERDVLADEILANAAEIAERYGVDAIPQKLREAGITNEKFINFVQTNIENGRARSNGRDLGRRDSLQPGSEEAGSRQDGSDSVAGSGALEGQGIRASEGGAPAAGRGAAAESGLDTPDENGVTPAQTREITAAVGGEMENGPATKFSVTAMAEGVGLEAVGSDEEGNVVFTGPDGTRFTGKDTITADYLKNLPNTVMGYMMADAKQLGTVTDAQADIIWQKYADMLNAFLQKGLAENGGIDNLASQWQWVAETVYKTVASNSDAQYSFSLDITRVCKKNEAVIKTIAETQRRLGYGVTPAQIMDIYLASEREGYQVPCPVCYVFSRYIRNGQYATIMINGQRKYGSRLQDPSTMTDEEKKKAIQYWRRELNRHKRNNEKHKKDITKAKGDIQSILDKIDKLGMRLLAGDVKEAESRKIMQEIRALDERYRAALQVVSQAGLDGWITQFAIHETKNGWELYDDSFQGFPEEMALDLRETATVLREYPAIQRYRNSRSAAAGKEITFEANNDIGEVPMMLGVSDLKDAPNYYKLAVQAQDDATREKMLEKAKERFVKAHIYAQRQSLRGGQRMWSWSDNIERLSPDVFVNLLQMEMLGGALQSYSKQLEGINLVARMGGYVNGSLMGKGIGYREVDEADVERDGDQLYLRGGDLILSDGTAIKAPVYESEGKYYTLEFDDVVGIDAYGKDVDGKHYKGLFELNHTLDKAGNILVGMDDLHVRAAMADDRVFFIIPWHSSGGSVHLLRQMLRYLNVDVENFKPEDFTNVQEEKRPSEVNEFLAAFWEAHKNETDFPVGIVGGIPSGQDGQLSPQQVHYKELRDAILTKKIISREWLAEINRDVFLRQLRRKVEESVDSGLMTSGDTEFIYPYEYWDESSTYDTADVNGARYLEYCRRLGYKPKFVGKLDGKPEKDFGNFADDKGYWKLLIDRRMYDTQGNFQDLTPVSSEGFSPDLVDPEKTAEEFQVTRVADDETAKKVTDRVLEREASRPGGIATVDYNLSLDKAVERYNQVLAKRADSYTPAQRAVIDRFLGGLEEDFGSAPIFSFVGEKGAAELDKASNATVRMHNRDIAIAMEEIDADPLAIKMATGWERGADGAWRYETSDVKIPIDKVGALKTGDSIRLGDLVEPGSGPLTAYPELADFTVKIAPKKENFYGQLKFDDKQILLNLGSMSDEYSDYVFDTGRTDHTIQQYLAARASSTMSHEIQHAIQFLEGFAIGDNVAVKESTPIIARLRKDNPTVMRMVDMFGGTPVRRLHQMGRGTIAKVLKGENASRTGFDKLDARRKAIAKELAADLDKMTDSAFRLLATDMAKVMKVAREEAKEMYHRSAGEVESRNVQRRMSMAPEQRETTLAETTEDVPRSEQVVRRSSKSQQDIRFSVSNERNDIFISNAEKAAQEIKMEKATPEQWLKMLEKSGGLKAGEDKWIGLSDWLKEQKGTVTKQQVLDYINEHKIQIEEVNYAEESEDAYEEAMESYQQEYLALVDEGEENGEYNAFEYAFEQMIERYGDDFGMAFHRNGNVIEPDADWDGEPSDAARYFLDQRVAAETPNPINETRMQYTTEGLGDYREIALTVPTIEPWNEGDRIHFGDAGDGRAIAWIRFGDAVVGLNKKALVIDEIQSKRHQEAREQGGYKDDTVLKEAIARREEAQKALDDYTKEKNEKYVDGNMFNWSREEKEEYNRLYYIFRNAENAVNRNGFDPMADEEYRKLKEEYDENMHNPVFQQLMDDWGKAGEEDRSRIEEQMLPFQERSREISDRMDRRESELVKEFNEAHPRRTIPAAPFEKNWHELAFKRMLRYAAENGYDYVVWTTGEQQADRYDIGSVVKEIRAYEDPFSQETIYQIDTKSTTLQYPDIRLTVGDDGVIKTSNNKEFVGKPLSDILGKDLAVRTLSLNTGESISGEGLRIGGEGMRVFYDEILPRFVNKYGKKWGVKVEDIRLYDIGEGDGPLTMHSIPVTAEMKESVMQGHPMFSMTGETDKQGNPINPDGSLKLDKVESIDDITNDDFTSPSRSVVLPQLSATVENAIGTEGKPVVIKKNIFERNARIHKELTPDQSRDILNNALYNTSLYGQNQPASRPYNWVVIGVPGEGDVNKLVLLEIDRDKDNVEIVHWHYIDGRGLEKIKRQAEREGGHILILPSVSEEAGALAGRPSDSSSDNKDTDISATFKDSAENLQETGGASFSVVADPAKIEELEAGNKVKVYRSMQVIDGKLYPPMSAMVNGELRDPIELGVWEQADEHPELADENGEFLLEKGDGSEPMKVAYAPYIHTRRSPLNEQFSSAYKRPNLVIVESEIPESELTSGYTADRSKKSTGEHDWPSGKVSNALANQGDDTRKVILSRWAKPIRIVPNSEVADIIAKKIEGKGLSFPYNVVTPGLREELRKRGVQFEGWQGNKPKDVDEIIAGMQQESSSDNGILFSVAYHGSPADFTEFEEGHYREGVGSFHRPGFYFASDEKSARPYAYDRGNGAFMYEVELPDDDGTNYIHVFTSIPKPRRRELAQRIQQLFPEKEIDVEKKIVNKPILGEDLMGMFTNDELEQLGYVGVVGPMFIATMPQLQYIMFNPKDIRVISKTDVSNGNETRFSTVGIAPNGKKSNLTDEQWKMVRTPAFKRWFGDWENDPENASKVVDENGEPRVVYHGTKWNPMAEEPGKAVFDEDRVGQNFENVDIDWNFFFTASEASARGYGRAVPVFLNIRNMEVHTINERVSYEMDEEVGHDIVINAHDAGSEYDKVTKVDNPDGVMYTIRAIGVNDAENRFYEAIKEWEGEHKQEIEDQYNALTEQHDNLFGKIDQERRSLYDQLGFNEFFGAGYDDIKESMGFYLDTTIDNAAKLRGVSTEALDEAQRQIDDVNTRMFKLSQRIGVEGRPEYEEYEQYEVPRDYRKTDIFALDNPNQIKSATDNNGEFSTENNDIRFSAVSDEQTEKLFAAAKERFGTTRDIREAGYVLPDGTMLDFSGRHWSSGDTSWMNGLRQVDHRDISELEFEDDGNTPSGLETDMSDFIRRGAIRIDSSGSINLATKPTAAQESVLRRLMQSGKGYVWVDFGDGSTSDHSVSYEGINPERVINDIRRYFNEGVKPESRTMFSVVSAEQDREYLSAVESGDMEKAQRMVAETAKRAMPDTKAVDKDGNPLVLFHGTPTYGFTEFAQPGEALQGPIWVTDDKRYAEIYADQEIDDPNKGIYRLFADVKNPVDLGYIEDVIGSDAWNSIAEKFGMTPEELHRALEDGPSSYEQAVRQMNYIYDYTRGEKFVGLLRTHGYDGAFALEEGINRIPTIAVIDPSQVKSAEPVTRDEAGNVIPLSQRFNRENNDIRFSVANRNEEAFFSNAARAVDGIQMTKATPEQWLKMIEKGGLGAVIGQQNVDPLMRSVYRAVPKDILGPVVDKAIADGLNIRGAMNDYLHGLAVEGPENDGTGLLRALFDEVRAMSGDPDLTDADIRYMIWKSTGESGDDILSFASDVAMKRRWGVGESDPRFSTVSDFKANAGLARTETDEAIKAAEEERREARRQARRTYDEDIRALTKAMAGQREYDKKTVSEVVRLAKTVMNEGGVTELTRREVSRLLTLINGANGKSPAFAARYADDLFDYLLEHIVKEEMERFMVHVNIKDSTIKQPGVEKVGKLDPIGQITVKAFRTNMRSKPEEISRRLEELAEKISSSDKAVSEQAEAEYQGLVLARDYAEQIGENQEEELDLLDEMDDEKTAYRNGDLTRKEHEQYVKTAREALRQSRMERIDLYREFTMRLTEIFRGSASKAKAFREAEKQRIEDIHHDANRDMQGVPTDEHRSDKRLQRLLNSSIIRFFAKPLATFDQMLRVIGRKSVTGEGFLWNRLVRQWESATEEQQRGMYEATQELDAKVSEVFGKKMIWSDLYGIERKLPGMDVTFYDGGEKKSHTLTQGNLLYIYMVDKMVDGRMKLRKMGITEEHVAAIKEHLDPRFIELADWLQDEYLVDKRNKYNEVHERMFGAPMAAIENYFPLKILSNARVEEVDLGSMPEGQLLPSTTTGSILKRRKNSLALDLMHTDAFSLVIEHIEQMEDWAAYAEFRRDINTLLSYKRFRNQVMNMNTIYGSGKALWENFMNVCKIATGTYRPKVSRYDADALYLNAAKGVTAAKIAFRVNTAIKQLLSFPAYFPDANPVYLAKSLATAPASWNWCMENLPVFQKRWRSRIAGDTRLMDTDSDWKIWKNNVVKLAARWGMTPNALVDATTVAIGAKAMYDTRFDRYIADGYTAEEADKRAKQDATILYNQTQQSSENAFVSAIQLDRTFLSVLLSTYRNSSMSYQRQLHDAVRTVGRMLTPGYMEESIEFMTRQRQADGLDEEDARDSAQSEYNRQTFRSMARIAVFGYGLQLLWKLGSNMWYLLFGDDDDKKEQLLEDALVAELAGPIEGLAGGNVISDAWSTFSSGGSMRNVGLGELPIESDIENIIQMMEYDKPAAVGEIINLIAQSGVGVNPQTITDVVVAILDAFNGDLGTAKEFAILMMRIGQVPQSTIDEFLVDEVSATAAEAQKMSVEELAQRYAKYKMSKGAPLTGGMYDEALRAKREKSYNTKFKNKVKERNKLHEEKNKAE